MATLDETAEREQILEDCIKKIKQGQVTFRLETLRQLIAEAEHKGNASQVQAYTQEYQELWHLSRTPGKNK